MARIVKLSMYAFGFGTSLIVYFPANTFNEVQEMFQLRACSHFNNLNFTGY